MPDKWARDENIRLANQAKLLHAGTEAGTPADHLPLSTVAKMVGSTKASVRRSLLLGGVSVVKRRGGVMEYAPVAGCRRLWPATFPKG